MTMPIWKHLQVDLEQLATDSSSLDSTLNSTLDSTTEAAATSDFAQLLPLLSQRASLFELVTLPLTQLVELHQSFAHVTAILLQHYISRIGQTRLEQPLLLQVVNLIGQAVYLDQFCAALASAQNEDWLQQGKDLPASETVMQQFNILPDLSLSAEDARQTLVAFSTSRVASILHQLVAARLEPFGVPSSTINQMAAEIADRAGAEILPTLAQIEAAKPWVDWYAATPDLLERHLRIDAYLDHWIQPRSAELVFNESFSLREIYIPLKAQPLSHDGEADFEQPPIVLEEWVKQQLSDPDSQDQVLLIQGGFGRGKTTFCRMFANWIKQHEYPVWTPILIPLQDVQLLDAEFEAVLQRAVPDYLTDADPDWLTHGDTRFLFVLDGFSELNLDDRNANLEQLLQQVGRFQETCANHPGMGHRVILTGRSLLIRNLERLLPPNLMRVELLPLDTALQDQWLAQWQRLTGANIAGLKEQLHSSKLSEQNLTLAREPLMLYFLASMHQDGELQLDILEGTSVARAKFLLYQRIFYWVLTKHRPGLLNRQLSPTEVESLRRLLAEAGLWSVQTGSEVVPLASIIDRLQYDEQMQMLLSEITAKLQEHSLTNALVTFYRRDDQIYLRFTHNSFGKLFGSRRLHEALEDWALTLNRRQKHDPLVPPETLYWQIFDLLGYGGLTSEMTEYLMVLLNANPELDIAYLFKRLEDFYRRWCAGEFVDAPPENFAQKQVRLRRLRGGTSLGQRQIDVYTGLNVMILLLELHGNARSQADSQTELQETVAFYPCGRQGMPDFVPDRLLRLIGYAHCISPSAFRVIVGPFLNSANLSGVTLTGVNLSGVDLSGADLRSADLSGANLRGANLSRANLVGASLDGADLSNADLRGANLIGAYLRGADLSSAALSGADLSSANLIGASLSQADLRDSDLSGAYLRGASLQTAVLSRAYLIGASLSGACLSNADLGQVDLSDANLHGADLSDVNLRGADLSGADLIGAYLNGASLCGARLCNASLNSADLIGADLCGADLSSANLIGADLSDWAGEVKWSERTKWQDVRGLEAAVNVPEALKQQLGLNDEPTHV
jgi:uncharacterized protein YjbI with pentapeptide repeats